MEARREALRLNWQLKQVPHRAGFFAVLQLPEQACNPHESEFADLASVAAYQLITYAL